MLTVWRLRVSRRDNPDRILSSAQNLWSTSAAQRQAVEHRLRKEGNHRKEVPAGMQASPLSVVFDYQNTGIALPCGNYSSVLGLLHRFVIALLHKTCHRSFDLEDGSDVSVVAL